MRLLLEDFLSLRPANLFYMSPSTRCFFSPSHTFFPLSSSMPLFVWLPIFHALTQDELSNLTKSLHCLSLSLSLSQAEKRGKESEKRGKERRTGTEKEESLWSSFRFREEKSCLDSHLEQITWAYQQNEYVISQGSSVRQQIMHKKSQKTRAQAVSCVPSYGFVTHWWLKSFLQFSGANGLNTSGPNAAPSNEARSWNGFITGNKMRRKS